jgi:hypothetical protein
MMTAVLAMWVLTGVRTKDLEAAYYYPWLRSGGCVEKQFSVFSVQFSARKTEG